MKFTRAIVRTPGCSLTEGITTANLGEVNLEHAFQQHAEYVEALEQIGLETIVLPAEEDFPDSTFVEDVALIFGELGIVTNPGDCRRKRETVAIRPKLQALFGEIFSIEEPGVLDGGDVMWAEERVYVGLSSRTNKAGAEQLRTYLKRIGLELYVVEMGSMLHLKTGVNYLDQNHLLITEELKDAPMWHSFNRIIVPSEESYAANSLWINGMVMVPDGFPQTTAAIEQRGYETLILQMSEFQKLDGGLSCLSIRF